MAPNDLSLLEAAMAQLNLVLERNLAICSLDQSEARFRTPVDANQWGSSARTRRPAHYLYQPQRAKADRGPKPRKPLPKTIRDFWLPEYCGGNLERTD